MTQLFRDVRLMAADRLDHGIYSDDGTDQRLCVWQGADAAGHVAAICNLLSHLEALADVLAHATWCDEIELIAAFDDRSDADRLFRLLTPVFLVLVECLEDCDTILRVGGFSAGMKKPARKLKQFVNQVWKHRGLGALPFHGAHHHGPYFFEDVDAQRPEAFDGAEVWAVDKQPEKGTGAVWLVVPSLVESIDLVVAEVLRVDAMLGDAAIRVKVRDRWGTAALA